MSNRKNLLAGKTRECILVIVIVALVLVFGAIKPSFLKWSNLANIFSSYAMYGIMAVGMMFVISTGNIDVSVGAQLAVVSMAISTMIDLQIVCDPLSAILLCMLMGLVLGLINGCLVALIKLPAIIVTLGTLNIMRGALLLLVGSSWKSNLPNWFKVIARTVPFADIRFKMTVYIWLLVCGIAYFIIYRMMIGRRILATGANPEAANRVGYKVSSSYLTVFGLMGVACGLGALFYTANVGIAQPVAGNGYEMTLIAAVVIGGTNFAGGKVSVLGTFLGVLLLSTVENGMIVTKVPVYWQEFIKGAIIILAIASSALEKLPIRTKRRARA